MPDEGILALSNIHNRLFLLILILIGASIWVNIKFPIRKGLDIQGGMRVVLEAQAEDAKRKGTWKPENLERIRGIMDNRVNGLGVAEPNIYTKPDQDQIVVELPGIKNPEQALAVIQTTASLEFRFVPELERGGEWRDEPEKRNGVETGYFEITGPNGPVSQEELDAKIFSKEPILSGKDLESNSRVELGPDGPVIHFEFRNEAKRTFEEFTRANIGKRLAIFLDKRLISAPTIEDVIPGSGIIRGRFTVEQAKTLSNMLNAGALPVPLKVVQQLNVEATLGNEAVRQTTIAGIIGLALVLLFMVWYYRLPGLLANLALILYTLFTFALFKLIPVTLTVPGIAGFILSIGMAVDANILIFERLKEERLAGKSLRAAIEAGFRRAFTAILDSNVCTLITCAILYNFGEGPVKGFALTLALGVAVSMFTAITCSRTFLLMVAGTQFGQNDKLYALGRGVHPKLNVVKNMNRWFAISALAIVPGVIFWLGLNGIKYSIEYTSGTEIIAQFRQRPSQAELTALARSAGQTDSRVLVMEGNLASITTRRLNEADTARLTDAIKQKGGTVVSASTVSGTVSQELTKKAFLSILYASVLIILYLAVRFSIGGFVEGLKFGTCAVIAMIHDVGVVWGAFAILGYALNWQVDSLFVTAILTVIGFSVHDTIVIFDRIRENLRNRQRGETFGDVTDRSIEQTLARSINTSLTVILTLIPLLIFGGSATRLFVTALLLGVISGTYSSIFNASPLVVLWKRLSGGDKPLGTTAPAAAPAARPAQRPAVRPSTPAPAVAASPVSRPSSAPAPPQDGSSPATAEERGVTKAPKRRKQRRR